MENNINQKKIDAINELVVINHDRTAGYTTAANESKHADLDSLFFDYAFKSQGYAEELGKLVKYLGGTPASGTKMTGKIYRAWMDVKAALASKDRRAILASCEFGEDAALRHYADVVENKDLQLSVNELNVILLQKQEIEAAHNKIKEMRDTEKSIA